MLWFRKFMVWGLGFEVESGKWKVEKKFMVWGLKE